MGAPLLRNIERVRKMQEDGHRLILWTCRSGLPLERAVEACKEYGITFVAVNQNDPLNDWPDPMSSKVYADYYFDDRAINPEGLHELYR